MTSPNLPKDNTEDNYKPDYGVAEEKIPEEWIRAREMMQRHPWAIFHVRKWYFPVLVAIALAFFTLGLFLPSFEFTVAAGALTVILYYWNKRARADRLPSKE